MTNKCKSCGRDYRIEPPFIDGHEISCPYCGAANVYHAPSRIEVPVGARRAPAAPAETESAPAMQAVSRFHVIRPSDGSAQAGRSNTDNALVERVRSRSRAEGRRKILRTIGVVLKDLFWLLVLAVLVIAGWKIFRAWQKTPDPVVVTTQPAPSEPAPSERPKEKVSEPPARPAEEKPTGPSGDVAITSELPKGARVSFYGLLPEKERIGAAEGHFDVVIPYGDKVSRCYAIESTPAGVVSAARDEYERELKRQGGFIVRSGVAYYVTRPNSPKSWNPPLGPSEEFCASKAYFGIAHELIRKQSWNTENLLFDVVLVFGKPENSVSVATARFGEKTYYSSFRKIADPIARKIRARDLPRPKPKAYRPTVIFTDGQTIGSQINGIRKVPRRAPNLSGQEYLRWCKLSEEAERQEREYRNTQRDNEDRLNEWKRKIEAPASEEEIRKVLMASSVKIVRREGSK